MITLAFAPFVIFYFINKARNKTLIIPLVFTYSLAMICWLLDRFYCPTFKPLSNNVFGFFISLHGLWHIFISMCIANILAIGLYCRIVETNEKKKNDDPLKFNISKMQYTIYPVTINLMDIV